MLWSNGLKKQRRSAWYKQTPDRCQEMADKMRNGTVEETPTDQVDTPLAGMTDQELLNQLNEITKELTKRLGV